MALEFIPNQPIIFEDVPDNFALPYLQNDTISFQYKQGLCPGSENVVCNPTFELEENLVTNGTFGSGLDNWTVSPADSWDVAYFIPSGVKARSQDNYCVLSQELGLIVGHFYRIQITVTNVSGNSIAVALGDLGIIGTITVAGTYNFYTPAYTSVGSDVIEIIADAAGIDVDDISVYDICWAMSNNQIEMSNEYGLCHPIRLDTVSTTAQQNTLSATPTDYTVTLVIGGYLSGELSLSVGDADLTGISGAGTFSFLVNNNGNTLLSINFEAGFFGCVTSLSVTEFNPDIRIDILDENNEIVDTIAEEDISLDGLWTKVVFNVADYIPNVGCYRIGIFDTCNEIPENPDIDDYAGVSNVIKIQPSSGGGDCGNLLFKYRCNNSAFGFDFSDADFLFYLRLNAEISTPKYPDTGEVFDYSSGVRKKPYYAFRKLKTLSVSFYPEFIHDALAVIKGCDYVNINDKLYVFELGEYTPDTNTQDDQDLMTGQLELSLVTQKLTKKNCADALPSGNYLIDPQTGDYVKSFE